MSDEIIKILLVEDNVGDAILVTDALHGVSVGKFEIHHVLTLGDALANVQSVKPDAVLLDLGLPDAAGLATLAKFDSHAPNLPVVVLTGLSDENLGAQAIKRGAQDYLVKGRADGQQIARSIRYAIERKRTIEELRAAREKLEERVKERTADLAGTIETLNGEVRDRINAQEQLKKVNRALLATSGCNQAIVRAADEAQLLRAVCHLIVDVGAYRLCVVRMIRDDGSAVVAAYETAPGIKCDEQEILSAPPTQASVNAARTGRHCVVRDCRDGGGFLSELVGDDCSYMALPLALEGKVLGVLTIVSPSHDAFDEEEVGLLVRLGEDIGYGIGANRAMNETRLVETRIMEALHKEQQRIGHDLHESLGQKLTGIAFMCKVVSQKAGQRRSALAADAAKIAAMVNECVVTTRALARGLHPVQTSAEGLMSALESLAQNIRSMYGIECLFDCKEPVPIANNIVATHLFQIAQESAGNAVKRDAQHIAIMLVCGDNTIMLTIKDDGAAMSQSDKHDDGMGKRIMNYRASVMGGTLEIHPAKAGGTVVTCTLPSHLAAQAAPAAHSSHAPSRKQSKETENA